MRLISSGLLGLVIFGLCTPLLVAQDRSNTLKFEYTFSSPEEADKGDNIDLLNDDIEVHEGKAEALFEVADFMDLGLMYSVDFWEPKQENVDDVDLHKIQIPLFFSFAFANNWLAVVNLTPGVHSDFEDVDDDDFRLQGGGQITYALNDDISFDLGVVYNDEFGDAEAYPVGGVHWQATNALTLDILFPAPRVTFATSEWFQIFAFGEPAGGEWNVGDDDNPQFDIEQEGYRVGGGAEVRVDEDTWFYLAGGAEFDREINLAIDQEDVYDDEIELDDSGFVRAGLVVKR